VEVLGVEHRRGGHHYEVEPGDPESESWGAMAAKGLVESLHFLGTLNADIAPRWSRAANSPARSDTGHRARARGGYSGRSHVAPIVPALDEQDMERRASKRPTPQAPVRQLCVLRLAVAGRDLFNEWLKNAPSERGAR